MPFDGIMTKAVASELNFLAPCKIEKISQPDKNTLVLSVYSNKERLNIYISLDSQNYRISVTDSKKQLPANAHNFCMLLRKHILGLKIKNVFTNSLERIITFCFEGFDDIDNIVSKKLVIELMGKHCNAILLDESGYIIDSIRHISPSDDIHRRIYPKVKYQLPNSTKYNFLDINSCEEFRSIINKEPDVTLNSLPYIISNSFTGISSLSIESLLSDIKSDQPANLLIENIYDKLTNLIYNIDTLCCNVSFVKNQKNKDDFLLKSDSSHTHLSILRKLDNFYTKREELSCFTNKKHTLSSKVRELHKKYLTRLENMDSKLNECENMDIFRIYGELITTNLYKLPTSNVSSVTVDNYYDNNCELTINLDKRYLPSINAKRFFKKYSKLKNTLTFVTSQKEDTMQELKYIESLIYQLEAAQTVSDLTSIESELINTDILDIAKKIKIKEKNTNKKPKKAIHTSKQEDSFSPLKYTIENYTLLVGKNNTENDYLSLKYASKTDLWFHVKDFPGSHCVLLLNNNPLPDNEILSRCASICAFHSKCKDSSSVLVDYCLVKYVKKPSKSRPGMVIYTDNKTLCVDPVSNQ